MVCTRYKPKNRGEKNNLRSWKLIKVEKNKQKLVD